MQPVTEPRLGLLQQIEKLLGPAPVLIDNPKPLVLHPKIEDSETSGPPSVEAKKFGRELSRLEVQMPDGKVTDFITMSQGSTNYSVIYADHNGVRYYLLVEQYRPTLTKSPGPAKIFADFPGGYNSTDAGVDPRVETLRELLEESGVMESDLVDFLEDNTYLDGIYTTRKGRPENMILMACYTGEVDLEPKLFGNKEEGERTVRVWYTKAELDIMRDNMRIGTPGVVLHALDLLERR